MSFIGYNKVKRIISTLLEKKYIYTGVIVFVCMTSCILMYIRCFYGTEISDEAYYVAEAKEMLNGNLPYAVNYGSRAVGFPFLLIPIIFVFKIISPNLTGVFLVTRLCYTTFKLLISYALYRILKKRILECHALLLSALLIPFTPFSISNFSYNSVPAYSMLIVAVIIYDVVEHDHQNEKIKLNIAGIIGGVACFANPGYGVALFVLLILIFIRSEKDKRIKYVKSFIIGIIVEVAIVVVPIVIQTGLSKLLYGVYRIYINPIPLDSLTSSNGFVSAISSFKEPSFKDAIFLLTFIPVYLFSRRYKLRKGKKWDKTQCALLSITTSFCLTMIYWAYYQRGTDTTSVWGYTVSIYFFVLMLSGVYNNNPFPYYVGLYPIVYASIEIVLTDAGVGIGRFSWGFPVAIGVFYILLIQKSKLARLISSLTMIVVIVAMEYSDYNYVYRDDCVENLTCKVEEGVYAGIFTTEIRSQDLPEIERYLNQIIGENDIYAFRDNVPFAYLMMHHGKMCEICTWDILQYSYKRNTPSLLFDYYRCRDMIPEKIVYIDYGRDENLSIEDPAFNYNHFIDKYYTQTNNLYLNDTFYHVITYEYNGNFDGNYEYWYETYYKRE